MKLLNISISLALFFFFIKNSVAQTYYSSKPSLSEKISIMYFKGNFNFLYIPKKNTKITLNKDSTFILLRNYCKTGETLTKGKWKLKNNILELKIKRKTKIIKLIYQKYNDDVFYKIKPTYLIIDKKKQNKKPSLLLLRKVN